MCLDGSLAKSRKINVWMNFFGQDNKTCLFTRKSRSTVFKRKRKGHIFYDDRICLEIAYWLPFPINRDFVRNSVFAALYASVYVKNGELSEKGGLSLCAGTMIYASTGIRLEFV